MNDENNVPLGYSKPQTALGNFGLTEEYGGLKNLAITVQKIEEMSEQDRAGRKSPKITVECEMSRLEKFMSFGGTVEECLLGMFICFGGNKMRIPLEYFYSEDPDKIAVLDFYLDILPKIYKEEK